MWTTSKYGSPPKISKNPVKSFAMKQIKSPEWSKSALSLKLNFDSSS